MLAIDPKDVNPLDLPSLPLESRRSLPDISALYFVLDEDDELLYIGRANNLVKRWRGHGHDLFIDIEQLGLDLNNLRIAWLKCDKRLINSSETKFIARLKPLLNYVNRGKRYQELIQTKVPCFLTPQKLNLYYGPYLELVKPINGKFNWQYGDKYRAYLIQNLKELAREFQLIKCDSDSEMVLLWADKWLQFIQEGVEDKKSFDRTIGDCKAALRVACVSLPKNGLG